MKKFVALYRVSTQKQGVSGLGLEAQKNSVHAYIKSVGGTIIQEFVEIESGGGDRISIGETPDINKLLSKRPTLNQAVSLAISQGATIVVKESSRLTRYALLMEHFLAKGLDFVCADSPNDTPFIIRIKTAINQDELLKVSERTRAALAKRVGTGELGNPNLNRAKGTAVSSAVRSKKAANNEHNVRALGYITLLRESAGMAYGKIAEKLNVEGFKTSRNGKFSAWGVQVLYERHKATLTAKAA